MDKKVETQIPCFDFTKNLKNLVEKSEEWKILSKEVREACEKYGCFQVLYNKIPESLHGEVVKAAEEVFDLPVETKEKNVGSKPGHGYVGGADVLPLFESTGIENASSTQATQAFTQLMWPNGNPSFCQAINSMSSHLHELELLILKFIMESYNLEKCYNSYVENNNNIFRMMKYKAPESNNPILGLTAHSDMGVIAILSQNSVHGIEILTQENEWIPVIPSKGAFIVFVGDSLKAWSNGRLHAVKHKVMMTGDKTRYSFALFSIPKDETIIEAPKELVDDEHPQAFRPFTYVDFINFYFSNYSGNKTLEAYASA